MDINIDKKGNGWAVATDDMRYKCRNEFELMTAVFDILGIHNMETPMEDVRIALTGAGLTLIEVNNGGLEDVYIDERKRIYSIKWIRDGYVIDGYTYAKTIGDILSTVLD